MSTLGNCYRVYFGITPNNEGFVAAVRTEQAAENFIKLQQWYAEEYGSVVPNMCYVKAYIPKFEETLS